MKKLRFHLLTSLLFVSMFFGIIDRIPGPDPNSSGSGSESAISHGVAAAEPLSAGTVSEVVYNSTSPQVNSAGIDSTTQLAPTDDSYVNGGSKANNNYGTATELIVKSNSPDLTRQAYMKFDLSSWTNEIGSAKLHVYGGVVDQTGTDTDVQIYNVQDNNWSESTLTWNTKPKVSDFISSIHADQTKRWYTIDVTAYVKSQYGTDKTVSFAFLEQAANGLAVRINSKENSANTPYLELSPLRDPAGSPSWLPGSTVQAANVTENTLDLSWTAASDPSGVTGYRIYQDGVLIATVPGGTTTFHVTGLTRATRYTFKVEAGNAQNEWSADGPFVTLETQDNRIFPVDDSYVNAGTKADMNYGMATQLVTKSNSPDLTRQSYMKFDLSAWNQDVGSAKLYFYGGVVDETGSEVDVNVYGLHDDSWHEDTITWNTKPEAFDYITSFHVDRTKKWYSIDVTSYVKEQMQQDKIVGYVFTEQVDNGLSVLINSKENTLNQPFMELYSQRDNENAPSWPPGSSVHADNIDEVSLDLNWTAASDPTGVSGYRIYRNGVMLTEVSADALTYRVTGLETGNRYTFKVEAGNSQGEWSGDGPFVTVDTPITALGEVKFGNVFLDNEQVQFKITTIRPAISWSVTDVWGQKIVDGQNQVSGGELTFTVPITRKGYFTLHVSAEAPNKAPIDLETTFAVLTPFDLSAVSDSPFGVATHFPRLYAGWVPELADLIAKAGIKNVRDGVEWNSIETQKGVYSFKPEYDTFMNRLKDDALRLFFVSGFNSAYYDNNSTPYTDEGRIGFANYVNAFLTHYRDQIDWMEVYNEFNISSFGDRGSGPADSLPEYYYPLLKQTYETVKTSYPDETVVGMATSGIPLDWIEDVFKLGGLNDMDAVSVHPYRYPSPPEGMEKDIAALQQLIRNYNNGADKPVWISEIGWPTFQSGSGVDEKTQAEYLIRSYVLALSKGVEKIFWYDFMNDGTDMTNNEHNFGLVRNQLDSKGAYTPKPAYASFAAMTRQLTGAKYVDMKSDGAVLDYRFEQDCVPLHVIWATQPSQVAVRTKDPIQVTDMMGNTQTFMPYKDKVYLTVNGDPLFLKGNIISVSQDSLFSLDGSIAVIGEPAHVTANLNNTGDSPIKVNIEVEGQQFQLSAPKGGKDSQAITLSDTAGEGERYVWGYLTANGKLIGKLERTMTIVKPYEVKVRPTVVQTETGGQELDVIVRNLSAVHSLTLSRTEWQLGAQSGVVDVNGTIEPGSEQAVHIPLSGYAIGESYPADITTYLDGYAPVEYKGNLDFNPVSKKTINVDGALDDSLGSPTIDLSKGTVKINTGYNGPDDLSGSAWLNWDDQYLYLSASIQDDVNDAEYTQSDIYKNDSIQFAVSAGVPGESNSWYEYGISQTPDGPQVYRWITPPGETTGLVSGAKLKVTRDEANQKTVYELALPWSELAPITPAGDGAVSFSLLVNDNDGAGREGYIEWGSGIGGTKDPSKFRSVQLMNPPAQQP